MAATDEGSVSLIDQRAKKEVFCLETHIGHPVTNISTGKSPYDFLIGSQEGLVIHYDLRSPSPVQQFQHPYQLPIKALIPLKDQSKLITVDQKQIRVHQMDNLRESYLAFETSSPTNDCQIIPNSGLMVTASEESKCGLYYIPSLGHAPK